MQKRSARVKCKNSLFKPLIQTSVVFATITMSLRTETPAIVSIVFQRFQCPEIQDSHLIGYWWVFFITNPSESY